MKDYGAYGGGHDDVVGSIPTMRPSFGHTDLAVCIKGTQVRIVSLSLLSAHQLCWSVGPYKAGEIKVKSNLVNRSAPLGDKMITDWFEDETFVAKLIQYGMEGIMAETSNARGIVAYSLDETYIKDAEEIAKLVKKHNEAETLY